MTPRDDTARGGGNADLRDALRALRALETRVAALEGAQGRAAEPVPAAAPVSGDTVPLVAEGDRIGFGQGFGLVGRAVLILAGAFLLRALTDNGILPALAGFALGLGYAMLLIGWAAREGRRGDRATAVTTGFAALVTGFPFVYETTALRTIVSPPAGALALTILTAAGLVLAVSQRLRVLFWAFGVAALGTITALHFATGAAVLFTTLLLTLGAATTVISYARGWSLLRWPVAVVADLVVLHLAITSTNPGGTRIAGQAVPGGSVLILAVVLAAVYLALFSYRALVQGRGVRAFDVVQSVLVMAVGYGAGSRLAEHLDRGQALLGWAALVTALVGYGVAFTVVRHRHGRGRAFFYFATLALLFLVLGSRHVVPPGLQAWAWTALGVATAWLGGRFRRSTLRAHSAFYLMLAFAWTGVFPAFRDAFAGNPAEAWAGVGTAGLAAVAAAAGCYVLLLQSRDPAAPVGRRIPRFLVGILALAGLGWLAVHLLTRAIAGAPPGADPAVVAVIRTGVLAVTAVALARAARIPAYAELGWLVYPLLVVGLGKLLLEDLKLGEPVALTLSFALFGVALIMAPRFLRRKGGQDATVES